MRLFEIVFIKRVITLLVVMFFFTACSSNLPVQQPADIASEKKFVSEYIIGSGDVLNIFVWRHNDISVTVPVRPDGKISIPLVEDMIAVDKTPSALARDLEEALSKYIRSPVVNVIVQNFVGQFSEQIRVVGEAAEPQALPYRENITLLDVMIEVGGLTRFASGNKAKIVRNTAEGRVEIPVKIKSLLKKGDVSANVSMRPGDILIIPESSF